MYLKSIKAYGFKSFADKIEFNLGKNINGIVGPNGSGKSNVVDAIRWVLGEQSIKSLRGDTSTDVIFSGSKSRKPLNSASITLTFDNSDLYLPTQYTEVSVKRVIYRSGDNEYFLNGERCRLKDITNLFQDSGADKESFNIIGQGKIDEILSTKPGERRSVFESAAGILKYKKRKEEALKKLERTNNNIDRVNDIILELENNLTPLEKQSKEATRYLELKDELGDLEISLIVEDIKNLNRTINDLEEKINTINDDLTVLTTNHSNYDIELLSKKDKLKKTEEEINHQQTTLLEITKSIEKIDADIRVLKVQKELKENPTEDKYLSLKETILKLETEINEIKNKKEEINKKIEIEKAKSEKEEKKYNQLAETKNRIITSLEQKNRDKTNLKYQIDVLEHHIENDSAIPSSIKNILNNTRLKGTHNILGKLIEIPEKYQTAITICLGGAINNLVVNTANDAKIMVEYLKENKLGRATFFPIDSMKERKIDEEILSKITKEDGFLTIASDIVKRKNIYDNIIKNQLGNVIIVTNLEKANTISKKINNRYKIVTLDGQVVNVGGSITGGSLKESHNYLKDKLELDSKKKDLNALEEKIKELEQEREEENKKLEKQEQIKHIQNDSILTLEKEKNNLEKELEDKKTIYQQTTTELQNIESLQKNESDKRLENLLTMYYSAIENKDNIESSKQVLIVQKENIEKEILEIEETSKKDNYYISNKEKNLKELEIKLNTSNIKLDHLLIQLGEDYGITFDKAKETYQLEIEDNLARNKVKTLKEEMKSLGYVNVDAIEEYKKVKERYEFLNQQKTDLIEAESTLKNIINEMNDIMKERFLKTFESVRTEFKKVFKEMFQGGNAELILTEPDNLLETGIEIEAVPSGKTLKSLSLLSGGEKTFTAISLLFAILNVRPVPFCILDEVEAALDDANVESFGNYLNKYRDKTQFILITHKKKTMEFVDILYGITMQESGVSKLVSVRLEDLKEKK